MASCCAFRLASASVFSILARSAAIISKALCSASATAFCTSSMACRFTSFTASSAARRGGGGRRASWDYPVCCSKPVQARARLGRARQGKGEEEGVTGAPDRAPRWQLVAGASSGSPQPAGWQDGPFCAPIWAACGSWRRAVTADPPERTGGGAAPPESTEWGLCVLEKGPEPEPPLRGSSCCSLERRRHGRSTLTDRRVFSTMSTMQFSTWPPEGGNTHAHTANLPLLQRELLHCARAAKQTPAQYLSQHEHLLLSTTLSSPPDSSELLMETAESAKRHSPGRIKENGFHERPPAALEPAAKRICTISPAPRHSPAHPPHPPLSLGGSVGVAAAAAEEEEEEEGGLLCQHQHINTWNTEQPYGC
ncbi:hypothetical protein CRUP_003339 [Coryphaenoides rupestris]|nr:hypothetical protein CRUP_003339 [Coryphaenoides rupestris]